MNRSAAISDCELYRYRLTREWDNDAAQLCIVMLNPSTADASKDDPTIRRCMRFTQDWGFNELIMVNLFAYRTPHPSVLMKSKHPVGPGNRRALHRVCDGAQRIVVAWGTHGTHLNQESRFADIWTDHTLYCFGVSKNDQPLHPLYQRREAKLKLYRRL